MATALRNFTLQYNWLIHTFPDRDVPHAAGTYAQRRIIGIGCGDKTYETMFSPFVKSYLGFEVPDTQHSQTKIEVMRKIFNIPFVDSIFDTVLCTEMREHMKLPLVTLKEIHRILKISGYCIPTCSFIWHIREELRDFFRYSRFGLQYLFNQSQLHALELNAVSVFWVTFFQEFVYYLYKFQKNILTRVLFSLLGWGIQRLGYILEQLDKDGNFATNYLVVAQKR